MFRVKQSPIIRSSIKLYLQHLVLMNRVWPAVVVDESEQECHHVGGFFGIKMLIVAQQCSYGEFMSPATVKRN
jgi:hypothetical protein